MSFSDRLPRGVRRLFRLPPSYARRMRDLDDEIAFHLDTLVARLRAQGLSNEDARAEAMRRFGSEEDLRAYCEGIAARREPVRRLRQWTDELRHDLRYTLRQIARAPALTATASIVLAIGIGANTAVFSIVQRELIAPMPFADGNRMVTLYAFSGSGRISITPTRDLIGAWADRDRSVEQAVIFEDTPFILGDTTTGPREELEGAAIPPNAIPFVGIRPMLGRAIQPADTAASATPVVLLGESVWRRDFGASTDVLGKSVLLNGSAYTVIGVMPKTFFMPFVQSTDAFVALRGVGLGRLTGIAKLRAGVTIDDANREMKALFPPNSELNPFDEPPRLMRARDMIGTTQRQTILMLFGAVGILLLIACANVGNLLLARSWSRQREFAVRAVLGAGRWRIARQVLTESVLLAVGAGALGIATAYVALRGIQAALPEGATTFSDVHIQAPAFYWTAIVSIIAGLLFGAGPAVAAAGEDAAESLKAGSRSASAGSVMRKLRGGLVIGEVALSVVLLTGAGLLVRTLIAMDHVNIGFEPHGLVSTFFYLNSPALSNVRARRAALDAVLENVKSIPGVRGAIYAGNMPPDFAIAMGGFAVEGRATATADSLATIGVNDVTPDFFAFAGIPLQRGRSFAPITEVTDRYDVSEVIINEKLAHRLWPNGDALGARVRSGKGPWGTVVGIVGDVRVQSEDGRGRFNKDLQVYMRMPGAPPGVNLLTRSDLPANVLLPAIAKAVRGASASIRTSKPISAEAQLSKQTDLQRFILRLIGVFALLAVVLAMVGLHGVVAFSVQQRTREIGVRVALGARATDVVALVLRRALGLAVGGVIVGVGTAVLATRALIAVLHGVSPGDPITLGAVAAAILSVALLAAWAPARRAARLDPVEALRAD
ncbi:MAG: ADOP family duplicated permease [Gemmatimonadales bacterium]